MAWQPEPRSLSTLAQWLRDSLSGHDAAAQKNASQMLESAKRSPDIINYLVYLCVTPNSSTGQDVNAYHASRTAAAIMLKNTIKASYKSMPGQSRTYLKANILIGLQDPHPQIRNFVGNVITEMVRQGGILDWTQVIPDLTSVVVNENGQASLEAQDGAMSAIFKICEDNKRALDQEYHGQRPLTFLLPKLLEFTHSKTLKIRSRALAAINVFLTEPIATIAQDHIDQILPEVVRLTGDDSEEVRRFVCRAFSLLADGLPAVLVPHIEGVIDYTIAQQSDVQKEELALDAAEFFFEASNAADLRDALGPFLHKIIPVLLDCVIYSEEEQLRLEGDEDDADVEDEEKDIKPQFATSKASRSAISSAAPSNGTNGQSHSTANGYAYVDDYDDSPDEGEIDDDEEDIEADPEDEWNLRKCSAAALDSLASHFGHAVFDVTLPWLVDNLQHKDWQNREAAVLALGAIGPGCMDSILPHLPQLVPYMLSLLKDEQPVVRRITCWALSRYSGWASHLEPAGKRQFFEPILGGILECMLDKNKKVQEGAASAFAVLEEAANTELVPYSQIIIQQFVRCFERYKDKNVYLLYDCVQTLAEHAGPRLGDPELVNLLMPALIVRWQKVQDQSREMFPLLECLAFVATALGHKFTPFAKPFFTRCIHIIQQNLDEGATNEGNPAFIQPDKDFLVTSLDLLSSIIQSLEGPYSAELASTAEPNMFQILAYCMKDANNDVRQSAYALLGDCAIYIFPQLQQYLPTLMQLVVNQLDLGLVTGDKETAFRVVNNACWSCGEIAMRQKEGMAPYVEKLLSRLVFIMCNKEVPDSLSENAAIAVGRLGIGCHQQLAPHLSQLAIPFLQAMQKVEWTEEKGHAYRGFANVVLDNPQAMESCLLDFFVEMANAPGDFLANMEDEGPLRKFEQVLAEYKRLIGGGWDDYLHNLPPPQEQALRQLYTF